MTSEKKKLNSSIPHERQLLIKELVAKGERNLKIAEILDSQDFLETHFPKDFRKEYLCSVIINRLYYGVYLIGKSKLFEKDNSIQEDGFLGHGTESAVRGIRNNDEAKKSKQLWVRLKGFYDNEHTKAAYKTCVFAAKLYKMRNLYDYNSDRETDKALENLKSCKEQTFSLIKKLKEL